MGHRNSSWARCLSAFSLTISSMAWIYLIRIYTPTILKCWQSSSIQTKIVPFFKMSLALEKFSQLVFSGKLQSMQLAGSILKSDIESKEMGVIIDSKLSQIKHVNTRQAETKQKTFYLVSCSNMCRTASLIKYGHYKSTIMPITTYRLSCIHPRTKELTHW